MSQEPRPERRWPDILDWIERLLTPDSRLNYHADGISMRKIMQEQQDRGEWSPNPRWHKP